MSRLIRWFVVASFAFLALAVPASAQIAGEGDGNSHFGVVVGFGLPSSAQDSLKILFDAERIDIRSRDFEIGVTRGRDLGGDWGVSYSQKSFKDGSVVDRTQEICGFFGSAGCPAIGTKYVLRNVQLRGVSFHRFVPFVTIARRAQVGITFAGGVAQVKGMAEQHDFYPASGVFRNTAPPIVEEVTMVPGNEAFMGGTKTIPLWRIEVTGAAILAPGLKVKFGTGLNFTNYPAASVSVSYLIGAR